MSVLCIGDRRLLERLDEKHDFEARLTHAGFRHEEFTLQVRPAGATALSAGRYEVKVTHAPTRTVKAYSGGLSENWVARFAEDLSGGLFGHPVLPFGQGVLLELTPPRSR